MEQMRINASIRRRQAKGDNRKLRREGMVPAVIYGGQNEPIRVTVNDHEVELILRGAHRTNAIFNLTITDGEGQEQTIIREVQRHPVTSRLVHIDFQRIDLEREIEVSVAVHVVGSDPKGVKAGGILEHLMRTVAVRCAPLNIPKNLEADLTNLDLNQSFHVRELTLPEGVQVMVDPDTALFTILPPKAEAEPVAEAAATAAEPELIGGKKPEEEGTEEKK
jgi:large subunit ribosomal protein L25